MGLLNNTSVSREDRPRLPPSSGVKAGVDRRGVVKC